MPTPQWFKDNQKVSAYVPPKTKQTLHAWMKEKRIKSESEAIKQILDTHLALWEAKVSDGHDNTAERLKRVEQSVADLQDQVQRLADYAPRSDGKQAKVTQLALLQNVK